MRLSAILEITHEGNGIFKVYPPPLDQDARDILRALQEYTGTGELSYAEESQIAKMKDKVESAISDLEDALHSLRRATNL